MPNNTKNFSEEQKAVTTEMFDVVAAASEKEAVANRSAKGAVKTANSANVEEAVFDSDFDVSDGKRELNLPKNNVEDTAASNVELVEDTAAVSDQKSTVEDTAAAAAVSDQKTIVEDRATVHDGAAAAQPATA